MNCFIDMTYQTKIHYKKAIYRNGRKDLSQRVQSKYNDKEYDYLIGDFGSLDIS
jgi:hypothetical protein